MLTWARRLAASERQGWRMVWPTWPSFKPKNWRVNPYDHRTYSDLFQPDELYITGWRGDFVRRCHDEDMTAAHKSLLPLQWYVDALNAVREKAGEEVPAFAFSDGTGN
jgi:hypothetical protein